MNALRLMLGICFFTLGENTPSAPHQEGEKGVDDFLPLLDHVLQGRKKAHLE